MKNTKKEVHGLSKIPDSSLIKKLRIKTEYTG